MISTSASVRLLARVKLWYHYVMAASNIPGKFDAFERMVREAKAQNVGGVLIHHPEVLGDTYPELVENLNKLSDAGSNLTIVPRADRKSR